MIREESRAPPIGLRLRVPEGHRNLPPIGYGHLEGASKSNFCPFPALSLSALRVEREHRQVGVKVNHRAASQGHDPAAKPYSESLRTCVRMLQLAEIMRFPLVRARSCTFLHVHCRDEEVGDRARTWNTHVPRIPGIIRDFQNWIQGGEGVILKIIR